MRARPSAYQPTPQATATTETLTGQGVRRTSEAQGIRALRRPVSTRETAAEDDEPAADDPGEQQIPQARPGEDVSDPDCDRVRDRERGHDEKGDQDGRGQERVRALHSRHVGIVVGRLPGARGMLRGWSSRRPRSSLGAPPEVRSQCLSFRPTGTAPQGYGDAGGLIRPLPTSELRVA